ncbi:sugar ABC transporter permease [Treponema brennaborense]|uniref:Xylose transport system permease protein XylH n=1 Tax=Treponema brennaborense (strain DSM 12168 / CIP 105900 / DD5/3) TaxID=906968 RepID=F4LPG9_TREBD|nr:sugar ABC transporter permease [Treponema brennaborense]AEE15980.1 ABC-type transporter, integral membrane subunit [Treponema brennaborense DSM 12168]
MNFRILKQNARQYGMFVALMVVMIFFTVTTGGIFMTPRNLSNLFDQTGYVAILAIGMTLVLIIRQIDLSVGFAAGFTGAIAALLMRNFTGLPVAAVVLIAMGIGLLIGLYQGTLIAKCGVPAFVVTLAGMFIFRGALLRVTEGTGTIIVKNAAFNALGNGFIQDPFGPEGLHVLTLILGIALIVFIIVSEIVNRAKREKYRLQNLPIDMFVCKLFFIAALILFFTWKLANYNGLSWTVVIVLAVLAVYHFFTNNTVLGRHIFATGGNPEAAELSGISVQKVTMFVFCSMGALAGLAGILFTARLQSATTTAGNAFEMDAIASCYVGGVSSSGGVGRVTGTIIGALVMSALSNGMNLMNIGISYQYMVRGIILILAVLFDIRTRRIKV